MGPLMVNIPTIAITGSTGKTTTREFIYSILKTKWKVLKTTGNNNLPPNTKATINSYDPSFEAILLELGMGKQGAGEKHCSYFQPNIVVITNIGTAHFGNLGNSIKSTAKFKSVLIKHMNPKGKLLINNDDDNSKLLETKLYNGEIITVGINKKADYLASNVKYLSNGMSFEVILENKVEQFFIPTFGLHNIYNALFAIAICHRFKFTSTEIRSGLENYQKPIKRLNIFELSNQSLLIDDTANANPQSVKAAVDVVAEIGKNKRKIIVLGSMLELGKYTIKGHMEVGQHLAQNKVDEIFTYGKEAKWIRKGAIGAGYPTKKIHHFNKRHLLHRSLINSIKPDSVILVKGSSSTKMSRTVEYIKASFINSSLLEKSSPSQIDEAENYMLDQSKYSIVFHNNKEQDSIYLSNQTLKQMNIEYNSITLHFGGFSKELTIKTEDHLKLGEIILPSKLTNDISIPNLPFDFFIKKNHLFLGPVIGFMVLPRYYEDPAQQQLRFLNYDQIKGLIFLFKKSTTNMSNQTITGYYYNPKTKGFVLGTFPYPNVIFNRTRMTPETYLHFKNYIGDNLFNYPYGNRSKWIFWKRMSKHPDLKRHLPKTKKYKNINSLVLMLEKYQAVYLKPTSLAGGKGILHIKKFNDSYLVSDNSDNQVPVISKENLYKTLSEKLEKNKVYIIQQEIPFNVSGNKLDFRVYIQKDKTKNWKYSGMETKVARKGSIISNSKNREKIMAGETALKEIYHLTENKLKQKIKEITELCIKALRIMESNGDLLGDAAFDLVIDKDHKVWLLELQLNYAAEIKAKRTQDERRVLPNILPTPFEYAKALTGF